jgi:hypothetical protein
VKLLSSVLGINPNAKKGVRQYTQGCIPSSVTRRNLRVERTFLIEIINSYERGHALACVPHYRLLYFSPSINKLFVEEGCGKDYCMSPFLLLVVFIVIGACIYGYRVYRTNIQKRAREKKRNQFNDRV